MRAGEIVVPLREPRAILILMLLAQFGFAASCKRSEDVK